MKLFFRILGYLRKVWPNVILGIIIMIIYAAFSGLSLGIVYPIVDKIFVKQTVESWKADREKASEIGAENIFGQTKKLLKDSSHSVKENWDKKGKTKLIKADIGRHFQDFLTRNPRTAALKILLIIGLILFFIKVLSGYFQKIIFQQLEEKMIMWIRNDFYHSVLQKPLEFFHSHKVGELISRATNDVKMVKVMALTSATTLLRNFLLIAVYAAIMFGVSWQLSLVTLVVVGPIYLAVGVIARKMKKYSRQVQEKFADITSILQEAILNIRIVMAFAMRNYEKLKFYRDNKKFYRKSVKMVRTGALATPFTEFMGVLITFVLLGYGGSLVMNPYNSMTAGKFLLFLAALLSTLHPLKELSGVYTEINKGLASAERVFGIIDEPVSIKDNENALKIKEFKDNIRFNHLSFQYPSTKEVLRNINFKVAKGEAVAFVGPSGGGKSTLMDLLIRFYDPTEGSITIDDVDIKDYKIDDLRNLMGIVTQEVILFDDTVAHNIAYGRLDAPMEDIVKAAKAANAHNFIIKMEKGYDTVIGERGIRLSGGQRQRLAIARAILKNPQILIFDEATSSLDSESEFLVQEAINRLIKGRTTFVIAHRLSTIRNSKRIMAIDKGRIVEQGTHEKLLVKNGLYKKLYEMQFRNNVEKN
jgi:subfamily B ATP-binding cassette protein MsbA